MIANGQNGVVTRQRLSSDEVTQIEQLADICNHHDGIELKLNWDMLRSRTGQENNDFLYYMEGQLVGFLALYIPNAREVEVSGMVHPSFRRRGVFRKLDEQMREELERRGIEQVIFSINHVAASGQAFAKAVGARYSFSEYRMVLGEVPSYTKQHEGLNRKFVEADDADFYVECMNNCFGLPEEEARQSFIQSMMSINRQLYTVHLNQIPIGTICAAIGGSGVTLHELGIMPEYRGRGYGRQVLAETVYKLLGDEYPNIEFQMRCHNHQSRELYEACGFEVAAAFDYYEVRVPLATEQGANE